MLSLVGPRDGRVTLLLVSIRSLASVEGAVMAVHNVEARLLVGHCIRTLWLTGRCYTQWLPSARLSYQPCDSTAACWTKLKEVPRGRGSHSPPSIILSLRFHALLFRSAQHQLAQDHMKNNHPIASSDTRCINIGRGGAANPDRPGRCCATGPPRWGPGASGGALFRRLEWFQGRV